MSRNKIDRVYSGFLPPSWASADTSSEDGYCIHSHTSSILECICIGNDGICTTSLEGEDQLNFDLHVSASFEPKVRVPSGVLAKVNPENLNLPKSYRFRVEVSS